MSADSPALAQALHVVLEALPALSDHHAHLIGLTVAAVADRRATPNEAINDLLGWAIELRGKSNAARPTLRLVR